MTKESNNIENILEYRNFEKGKKIMFDGKNKDDLVLKIKKL